LITQPPVAEVSNPEEPFRTYPQAQKGHTFGVPIEEVLSRENATLPLIVAQCVIAVDQYGLQTEYIYRASGSVITLANLKHLFDFEPEHIDPNPDWVLWRYSC
jgi:hypothetical protein